MDEIKFIYKFEKLPKSSQVTLLNAIVVQTSDLSKEFLKYENSYSVSGRKYLFPIDEKQKEYILLFLWSNKDKCLFTSLRSYTCEKFKYYKSKIGSKFSIKILQGEKDMNDVVVKNFFELIQARNFTKTTKEACLSFGIKIDGSKVIISDKSNNSMARKIAEYFFNQKGYEVVYE